MPENSLKKLRLVNYVLVLFILAAVILLARNVISVSLSKKPGTLQVPKDRAAVITKNKNDIMQYSPILEKNPFGRPMKLHPIEAAQESEKSLGSLSNLILIGTVTGPENVSYAIFKDKSQPGVQEIFGYKENVFNYGILTRINMTSVNIVQGTETYTLTFPSDETTTVTEKQSAVSPEIPQTSFAKKVGEQEYILDSRRVQQSLENPEQILTDARLLPNFVDGRQEGFKISEVIPEGLYDSLGIKNGDVLLRVNGLEISNPEVAIQAMTALKGMNRVNLDIIRSGKNMSMSYQIR